MLVCGSIDAAITALYRVHTDICPEKVGFDPQALLTEIKRENISPENFSFAREHTHPPLYLRIKALSFFDSSQLLRDWRIEGLFRSHDTKLSNQMDEIIGFALYYTSYSTWKGPCIYLEDLYVEPKHRNTGMGSKLFDHVVNVAKERKVSRMDWQIIDWNEPAIDFYKRKNAVIDDEWLNGRLFFEE